MKKITYLILAALASMLVIGCSETTTNDDSALNPQIVKQQQEEAAYAALFEELETVNAKYLSTTPESSPMVVGNPTKTLTRAVKVLMCDAMGAFAGRSFGPLGIGIGAIGASAWAACHWRQLDNFILTIKLFTPTTQSEEYVQAISLSDNEADQYDLLGLVHNTALSAIFATYDFDDIEAMSYTELSPIALREVTNTGYLYRSPTFSANSSKTVLSFAQGYMEQSDYDAYKALDLYCIYNPEQVNDCLLLKNYLNALENISDEDIVNWQVDYRNTIEAAGISSNSKQIMRACMSIGLASAELWEYQEQQ